MKYHYSYFIYPYIVKEKNYNKYLQKLLNNEKCTPKTFEGKKQNGIYNFFLPTAREYMFKSFGLNNRTDLSMSPLDKKLKENMLKNAPCTIFEYNIGKNAQAKTGEEYGIFFKIEKIEIICFKTGLCFLALKTNVEDTNKFSDLLNFNLKFRELNSEINGSDVYSNIKIQTSIFSDIKKLSELIREITGGSEEAKKIDIDVNKFLIYSYVCVDEEHWNDSKPFLGIENEFIKLASVLSSTDNSNSNNDRLKSVNLGKYERIGISKAGLCLISSGADTLNYTKLPYEFENKYFYTYIFTLYEKFYLKKLLNDFKGLKRSKAAKEFVVFTNDVWIHELTNDDNGTQIFNYTKEALELQEIYGKVKEQYDVTYKSSKMKESDILNKIVLVLLAISIITNIINFINLHNLR